MIYIGIDPGKGGGLAALGVDGVQFSSMPNTDPQVWDWLSWYRPGQKPVAVIESIAPGGFVGKGGHGGKGQAASSQAKLYGHYRMLCAFLTAAAIPYVSVGSAKVWRAVGVGPRKREWSRAQWKRVLRNRAAELFPELHVTLAVADALLLAWYCRETEGGVRRVGRRANYSDLFHGAADEGFEEE